MSGMRTSAASTPAVARAAVSASAEATIASASSPAPTTIRVGAAADQFRRARDEVELGGDGA